MKLLKLSLAASLVAAAGCAVSPPDNTYAFRPGAGTVENVQYARVAIPGGTAPETPLRQMTRARWMEGYQLSLRMDDGTQQAITQDSDAFQAGDRVQVAPEGRVLKAPPSAPSVAWRAGNGVVQSAAGGSSAAPQQLNVRMDDGTTQLVTVQGASFQPGQRVAIGADGRVLPQ
jgi:outer membrane lipoprotein SlyB